MTDCIIILGYQAEILGYSTIEMLIFLHLFYANCIPLFFKFTELAKWDSNPQHTD